jgi:hypothetical protein
MFVAEGEELGSNLLRVEHHSRTGTRNGRLQNREMAFDTAQKRRGLHPIRYVRRPLDGSRGLEWGLRPYKLDRPSFPLIYRSCSPEATPGLEPRPANLGVIAARSRLAPEQGRGQPTIPQ